MGKRVGAKRSHGAVIRRKVLLGGDNAFIVEDADDLREILLSRGLVVWGKFGEEKRNRACLRNLGPNTVRFSASE